jgi:hypothetical protein
MGFKKIFIFGFPHSGTTILRTIISHIPKVYTVIEETFLIDRSIEKVELADYDYVLFKNPVLRREYFQKSFHDVNKIFIIRNPLFVISSYNSRHKDKINDYFKKNVVDCYLEMARAYLYYQKNTIPNLYFLRYEDMFNDNFSIIKNILSKIDLEFTEDIFDNKKYKNISHKNQNLSNIPTTKPSDLDHEELRLYQVNQELRNNNDIGKIRLSSCQLERILKNQDVNEIYPDIKNFTNFNQSI